MKKTRVMLSNLSSLNYNIGSLEDEGWEVVDFKDINLSDGEIYILLMAQKEEDKSIYEKMYLLEQYCAKNHCRSGKCRIENMCNEYQGNGSFLWDFKDVEKAYEVIRDGDR